MNGMTNKLLKPLVLIVFQILFTVLCDEYDLNVRQSYDENTSDSHEKRGTAKHLAHLLPMKKPVEITGFIPHIPSLDNTSDKVFADRPFNEKYGRGRDMFHTIVDAIYNCTPDSILSSLRLHSEFNQYFNCYQTVEIPHENRLNATMRRRPSKKSSEVLTTPVNTYDSVVRIVFFNGNQMYYTGGKVDDGYCQGDQLTIMNVNLAKKGSCQLRSGVQQLASDSALLNVSGKCQSMCFGYVNVFISPGLRN